MTKTPKPPPRYTEQTLIRIIQDCYDLDDLTNLCNNLRDLEENKDLEITTKMQKPFFCRIFDNKLRKFTGVFSNFKSTKTLFPYF